MINIAILKELVEHLKKKGICKKVIEEIENFDKREYKKILKRFDKAKRKGVKNGHFWNNRKKINSWNFEIIW